MDTCTGLQISSSHYLAHSLLATLSNICRHLQRDSALDLSIEQSPSLLTIGAPPDTFSNTCINFISIDINSPIGQLIFPRSIPFAFPKETFKALSVVVIVSSKAAHLIVAPFSNVHVTIGIVTSSVARTLALSVVACIYIAVGEATSSLPVHFVVLPITNIFGAWIDGVYCVR
jgi:hypothetical protein